jgi:dienelactone hydrolase
MGAYMSANELFQVALQLHQSKDYARADKLLQREGGHFPEAGARIYFWRMCVNALAGKGDQAIRLFDEAIAAGYWYSERMLREDPDLASLQGNPGYDRLVRASQELKAIAQNEAQPYMTVLSPERGEVPPALLALHGNNSSSACSEEHWRPAVAQGWLLALPQSTQVGPFNDFVWDDFEWAEREIREYYTSLPAQHQFDRKRVVVGGFSMGGGLAARLALTNAIDACGFIVGAPYLRNLEVSEAQIRASVERGLRGYMIIGEADTVCYPDVLKFHEMLSDYNMPCELRTYPGLGHDFPPDFEQVLPNALSFVESGK